MTENEFYEHWFQGFLVLGFLFWWMMGHLGKKNCVENPLEKHIVLKVFGGISIAFGIVMFVAGVVFMTKLEFPDHSLQQPISPNMFIRPIDAYQQIGYPTKAQSLVINKFIGAIQFVGLGLYLWRFRKSGTKWWQKTLKVVAYTAMFMLLPSAIDFHYFDIWEFISPALLIILETLCLIDWRGLRKNNADSMSVKPIVDETKNPDERQVSSMDVEL